MRPGRQAIDEAGDDALARSALKPMPIDSQRLGSPAGP